MWPGVHHYQFSGQIMQLDLPILLVLHADPEVRGRLRSELRAAYRIQDVGSWDDLREAIRRSPPNAVALVDPYHDVVPGGATPDRLRHLLSEFPSSPVIATYSISDPRIGDTQTLISWGVAEVLDLKRELTGPALLRRLNVLRSHRMRLVLEAATPRFLPSRARALLADAAEVVAAGGKAPDLAERMGAVERTLHRWCAKFGLPEPRRLLACCGCCLRLICSAKEIVRWRQLPVRAATPLMRVLGTRFGWSRTRPRLRLKKMVFKRRWRCRSPRNLRAFVRAVTQHVEPKRI